MVPLKQSLQSEDRGRAEMHFLGRVQEKVRGSGNTLKHPAFLAVAGLVLAAAVVLVVALRTGYERRLEEGKIQADTISRLLEEQTARSFQAVDLVLQSMADAIRTFSVPENDPTFQQLLTKRLQVLPYVRALFSRQPSP